jgi:hypothetical protein
LRALSVRQIRSPIAAAGLQSRPWPKPAMTAWSADAMPWPGIRPGPDHRDQMMREAAADHLILTELILPVLRQ